MPERQEELRSLKTKRTTIKSNLTRFVTFINNPQNHNKCVEIKHRIKSVEPLLAQLEEVHIQIQVIDETQVTDTDISEFENKYFQALSSAESIITSNSQNDQNSTNNNQSNNHNPQFKLPDIKLPVFSGSYTEWITFRDSYQSLIHENQNINIIQKFHYLRSSLTGEALQTISHLTLSTDNYIAAWDLLVERYQNKRLIIQHHIRAIFSIPTIHHKDAKSLRQILHIINSHLKALESIGRPTNSWDDLLVYLIASKFDQNTTITWEGTLKANFPTLKDITNFITERCQILESLEINNVKNFNSSTNYNKTKSYPYTSAHVVSNNLQKCIVCKQNHHLYQCSKFLALNAHERLNEVKKHKLCHNCLRNNHKTDACASGNCKTCDKKHNTLLHFESHHNSQSQRAETPQVVVSNHCAQIYNRNVLLSTAMIKVVRADGQTVQLRALLDNGSQNHFITNEACKKLNLNLEKVHVSVAGIGNNQTSINRATHIKIHSNYNSFKTEINCLVVPEISLKHPLITFDAKPLNIPKNIKLADPGFNVSNNIDLLIGNEIFWNLIRFQQIQPNGPSGPILQNTHLGYIVAAVISIQNNVPTICHLTQTSSLEKQMERFWEVNDGQYPQERILSKNDTMCEEHFKSNVLRNNEGRFIVKLPFKTEPPQLGPSRNIALQRFKSLERKISKTPHVHNQYKAFIHEYVQLGHMEQVPSAEVETLNHMQSFYLPHHCVIKDSTTTKLRVVFDGSAKSVNGKSLNDNLLVGPALQQDLICILLRFRTHEYVISGDIAKMYRQILVHPDHRNYQLILWRDNQNQNISTYRLNTVTYGLTSSPYLAIKCLQELAIQEANNYPESHNIILRDFYVDDLLTGANSQEGASRILQDLIELLAKGGFELRKFASNSQTLLQGLETSENNHINLDKQSQSKTLGIHWNTQSDEINFSIKVESNLTNITKRTILSLISKLFDPLGLVSPITITAKIILQKVWILKLDWDEEIPHNIKTLWIQFINSFQNLNKLKIPRKVIHWKSSVSIELHGFCDASQESYGACVYLRTIFDNKNCKTHLLCSKNRVAPIKTTTIPRLELCGAVLLTKLVNKIKQNINIPISKIFYWTDSKIVLSWLQLEPNNLKIFVGHRVADIQTSTSVNNWHYVHTSENPADILSRGTSTNELINSELWWNGPRFLKDRNIEFSNSSSTTANELPETKTICCLVNNNYKSSFNLLTKFSSFVKLIRVTAYCRRFIHNIKNKNHKLTGNLTCDELKTAESIVLKLTQTEVFSVELHALSKHHKLPNSSCIQSLNPFIDGNGLLRVGGRLKNADIAYDYKHQIILPKKHHVTNLVIIQAHISNLHTGCQNTLSAIRAKFWPISGTSSVRKIIKSCVTCRKNSPMAYNQLMGDLPKNRVTPSKPFNSTGVDYAGPFILKNGFGRTNKTIKAFIAIFVCFTTRAVHIELACDYTATTFLNVLKRFIARRGKPLHMFSDNGTNFVGANNELHELKKLFDSQDFNSKIIDTLATEQINWHFIPPRAPHFGGLWEAAVKSTKRHLKRIIGNTVLNYAEMYTLLTMVEACLNSRPLIPLSNDPSDLQPLTPGHFLIGDSLRAPPEPDIQHISTNRLSRYQLIEQLKQSFWRRWSMEVLHHMQQRNKWKNEVSISPQVNDLVVLKEDNLPPLHWAMGRVVDLHPGSDGRVRVVSVKTVRGIMKRPITKVCPISDDTNVPINSVKVPPTVV